MNRKIDISHKTIFFIAGFLGLLWILIQIKEVIVVLFVAIIFMSALSPAVDRMVKWKIPKPLAIAVVYLIVIGILALLIAQVVSPMVAQTSSLFSTLPTTLPRLLPPGFNTDPNLIQQELTDFSKNAFSFTITVFSHFITLISVVVLTFYLLLDRVRIENMTASMFVKNQERVKILIDKIEDKLGAWMRGQIILSILISVLCYILLLVLGIPYALPLAILAGFLELVPVIGPIVSAVPAIIFAFLISPALALFVGLGYFAIQQLESHVIVPQLMKKAVGLNPLVIILAIAIGGRLLGIAGALLAVPITVVAQVILEDYFQGGVIEKITEE